MIILLFLLKVKKNGEALHIRSKQDGIAIAHGKSIHVQGTRWTIIQAVREHFEG